MLLDIIHQDYPEISRFISDDPIQEMINESFSKENDELVELYNTNNAVFNRRKSAIYRGSKKKIGLHDTLISLTMANSETLRESADKVYEKYSSQVLDWNQKKKLRVAADNLAVTSILKGTEDATDAQVSKWIKDNLPFAEVDTSKIDKYTDYRLHIEELVKRNILVRSLCGDTDHYHQAHVAAKYLKLDNEQKAWYALNFGFTYRTQWATAAAQLFPYPHTQNIHDISYWCSQELNESTGEFTKLSDGPDNFRRITVGKDCKWNKFQYPKFFRSVQIYSEGGNLYNKLKEAASVSDDPNENYLSLRSALRGNLHGIGRMTAFLAMQILYEFFDWPINGYLMDLEEQGTWSCRTGCIAMEMPLTDHSEFEVIAAGNKIPSGDLLDTMNQKTAKLIEDINESLPFHSNVFEIESVMCEITDKYLLKEREFSFWTSIEQSELVMTVIDEWENNYVPTDAYPESPDLTPIILSQVTKRPGWMPYSWLDRKWMKTLNHLGIVSFMNELLEDEPCITDLPGVLPPDEVVNEKFYSLVKDRFRDDEIAKYREEYDPRLFIRWKKDIDMDSPYVSILNDEERSFIQSLDSADLYHQRV